MNDSSHLAGAVAEKSKHTPGPWRFARDQNGNGVKSEDDFWITQTVGGLGEGDNDANARLIAAAPDLLDALKLCAGVVAGETFHKNGLIEALEAARAAIRKAEGE